MRVTSLQELDESPGVYQLHIHLPEPARIQIGKLGTFDFPAGRYVYTGSALGGLQRRIGRHLRAEKTLHWHIDYLLQHAQIEAVFVHPTRERLECAFNQRMLTEPHVRVIAPRFGSRDCRCVTHLLYLSSMVL